MSDKVDSTGDARIVNNAVRHQYRVLSEDEKAQMLAVKDQSAALIELCQGIGASREMSLAITKVEEAAMWAVKHITK